MDDIFIKIINREIPADIVYEDEKIIAIKDIKPQAKTHILIIPKKKIPSINELEINDRELLWDMFLLAKTIASELWISEWYNLKINVWKKWWQEIMHLHLHMLSNL